MSWLTGLVGAAMLPLALLCFAAAIGVAVSFPGVGIPTLLICIWAIAHVYRKIMREVRGR